MNAYAEHYDATAAKGLCWECKVSPVAVSEIELNGRTERVASLWCLDCQVRLGMTEEAEGVN